MNPIEVVKNHLLPTETLLWAGRSGSGAPASERLRGGLWGVFLIPTFGYIFFVSNPSLFQWPPPTFSSVFWLVALGGAAKTLYDFLGGLCEYARWRMAAYAVTNQRLIILLGPPRSEFISVLPSDITAIERRGIGSNRGDIVFQKHFYVRLGHSESPDRKYVEEMGFYGVENPLEVERLIRELRAKHDATSEAG